MGPRVRVCRRRPPYHSLTAFNASMSGSTGMAPNARAVSFTRNTRT